MSSFALNDKIVLTVSERGFKFYTTDTSRNRGSELFLHLDSHLIKEVTSVANFVIGSLKLRLQLVHPFLTLLQLALKTQNTHRTHKL